MLIANVRYCLAASFLLLVSAGCASDADVQLVDAHHGYILQTEEYPGPEIGFLRSPARLSDKGFAEIVPSLQRLHVSRLEIQDTDIDDQAVSDLCQLRDLHELNLCGTRVTPKALENLRCCLHLEYLDVDAATFTAEDVQRLNILLQHVRVRRLNRDNSYPTGVNDFPGHSDFTVI